MSKMNEAQKIATLTQQGLTRTQIGATLAASGMSNEEIRLALNTHLSTKAQNKQKVATYSLSNGFKGLAASLGISTVALGSLIAGFALFSVGIMQYKKYSQAQEEARQSAQDMAEEIGTGNKFISDSVTKYQELHKALLEAKGDEEKSYSIKQELLTLQTELNDKYGDEYRKLNLVTNAYKDQTDAIKNYNKELGNTYLNENEEQINKATEKMTSKKHYNLSLTGISGLTDEGKMLRGIVNKYRGEGMSLLDDSGDGSYNQFSIHLDADPEKAYKTINAFETDVRNKAKELGDEKMFDGILDVSSDSLKSSKKIIDDWGDIYNKSLLSEIATDDDLSEEYDKATKAVQDYNDAVLKSEDPYNDADVNDARKRLNKIKSAIEDNEGEWGKYSSVVDETFSKADTSLLDFADKVKNSKSSIGNLSSVIKDMNLSDVDLKAMYDDGTDDVFDILAKQAKEYGLEVDDLISLLVQLGVVQGTLTDNADSTQFTDVFALEDADGKATALGELSGELDTLQAAYSSLNDAMDEYSQSGSVTIDQLQSILANGTQFLDYLVDEEGNLRTDEQAMYDLAQARLIAMEAQIQQGLIDNISSIQNEGDAALYLASTNYELANSYQAVNQAALNTWQSQALAGGKISKSTIDSVMDKYKRDSAKINNLFNKVDLGSIGGKSASQRAADANKKNKEKADDANKAYMNSFQAEYDWLQYQRDLDLINESEYINKLNALNQKYFAGKMEYVDEFRKYNKEVYDGLKKQRDQELSDAKDLISHNENLGRYDDKASDKVNALAEAYKKFADDKKEQWEAEEEMYKLREEYLKEWISLTKEVYDEPLDFASSYKDELNGYIDVIESQGDSVGADIYKALIDSTEIQVDTLKKKRAEIQKQITDGLAKGVISSGDENWVELQNAINDCDKEILSATVDLNEFNKTLIKLDWSKFDELNKSLSNTSSELDNIVGMLDEAKMFNDKAQFTDEGFTTLAMHLQKLETAKYLTQEYSSEVDKLEKSYKRGELSLSDYTERLEELQSGQYENIETIQATEQAILDLYEKQREEKIGLIQDEIDALQSANDEKDRALSLEKAQMEVERLKSQYTKKVYHEGQGWVFEVDTDALKEAQENLRQEELQDEIAKLEDKIKDLQDETLDLDEILKKSIQDVNKDSTKVYNTLISYTKKYGVKIDQNVLNSWKDSTNALTQHGQKVTATSSLYASKMSEVKSSITRVKEEADRTATSIVKMLNPDFTNIKKSLADVATSLSKINSALSGAASAMNKLNNMKFDNLKASIVAGVAGAVPKVQNEVNKMQNAINSLHGKAITNDIFNKEATIHMNADNASEKYALVDGANNVIASGLTMQQAVAQQMMHLGSKVIFEKGLIQRYASGGIVGSNSKESPLDALAKSVGEDKMIAVQNGEWILNKQQQDRLTEVYHELAPYHNISNIYPKQDYSRLVNNNNQKTNTITYGDINVKVEGVQNVDGFAKALKANIGNVLRQIP